MRKLYYTFILLFSVIAARAQEPAMLHLEGWGGASPDAVSFSIPTYDGGFILSMTSLSLSGTGNIDTLCSYSGPKQIFRKYNANASIVEWTKCYGDGGDSSLSYIFPLPDGTAILGGDFGSGGLIIQKRDGNDNIVWERHYSRGNSPVLKDMIPTSDGGYVMLGESSYADTNFLVHYGSWTEKDIIALKVDSLGVKQWGIVLGGSQAELAGKVLEGADGCLYVVGLSISYDYDITNGYGNYDALVAKLDKDGNKIWVKKYGGTASDVAYHACHDNNGGILITGSTKSNDGDVNGHIIDRNVWVVNIDSAGTMLWNNCYGGGGAEYGWQIAKAGDGSIWVGCEVDGPGGQIDITYGHTDAWLLHIDSIGNFINAKVMGCSITERINVIQALPGNTVLVGGFYRKADGVFSSLTHYSSQDVFIATFSPWSTDVLEKNIPFNTISISPNPATNEVHIKVLSKANKKYKISIVDITGKEVFRKALNNELVISVSDWVKGIYTVIVSDGNERIGNAKLIVQ